MFIRCCAGFSGFHVNIEDDGSCRISHAAAGDTIEEVLQYVQCSSDDLIAKLRRTIKRAVREKRLALEESADLLRRCERGMKGYRHLEGWRARQAWTGGPKASSIGDEARSADQRKRSEFPAGIHSPSHGCPCNGP